MLSYDSIVRLGKGDYDAALKDLEKGIGKAENIAGL